MNNINILASNFLGLQVNQFNISISNCNSVDRADVVLTKGTLNIKYGPNGLGKSTLAKAIVSQIRGMAVSKISFHLRTVAKRKPCLPKWMASMT